ncbi:hypothetical protein MPER_12738, partial [Moniliophthora perniciosa FA553]
DRTHTPEYYNPEYDVKMDHGTQHVSVVDYNGMATSLTSTINLIFGSQVLDPETGVILNDEVRNVALMLDVMRTEMNNLGQMDDFSVPGTPNGFGLWPSPYNYPEPHKKPLSSTVPSIMENSDGSFHLAIGGSGGSIIFGAVFQVLINLNHWGMNIGGAIESGRVHDQLYPETTIVDNTYPEAMMQELRSRGHNLIVLDVNRVAGIVNAVMRDEEGTLYAASDSRKNGIAAGY